MKKYIKEIKLAITAIIAIAIIYYGINFLKGINLFSNNSTYCISFKDISGLEESNAVYASGYNIGTVRSISYDYEHPGNILVKIEVDSKVRIPQGSYAQLVSSMLGSTTLQIKLGASEQYLKPGDTFPGFPPSDLMGKISDMTPTLEQMLFKIDSLITSINAIVSNPAIRQTLQNTEKLTASLNETTSQINKILMNDAPLLIDKLNKVGDNMCGITNKLNELDYATTLKNVNTTLEQVNTLTADIDKKINSKEGSLGLLLNDKELYYNLTSTTDASAQLLRDLKEHPKRYVHFSIFGKKDK